MTIETYPLGCPYCGGTAHLKDSARVYRRSYGLIYLCENYPECDAYVGVHKGTCKPLGRLADPALRRAKKEAHKTLDPLWKNAPFIYDLPANQRKRRQAIRNIQSRARARVYAWLARSMKLPASKCHIGMFDTQQCLEAKSLCESVTPAEIRDWAKERGL